MVIWMIYTWTCTLSQEGDIQKTVWVLRYLSLVHFFSFKRLCQSCLKGKGRNHWKNSFLTTEIPTPHGLDAVWTQTLPYSIYARESNHYYNKFQFPKKDQIAFLLVLAGPWHITHTYFTTQRKKDHRCVKRRPYMRLSPDVTHNNIIMINERV